MKKYLTVLLLTALTVCPAGIPAISSSVDDKTTYTKKEVELRLAMRELFTDNLVWMRIYANALVADDQPAAEKARMRLWVNENGMRAIFKQFYDNETSGKLPSLISIYMGILPEFIDIAKRERDTSDIESRIKEKSDMLGEFFARANMNWDKSAISAMFSKYHELLRNEIKAQVKTPKSFDTQALDATFGQAKLVADTLTLGIMKHHPEKLW